MGWRRWLSERGILAYWFLLLPTTLYVLAYSLVFLAFPLHRGVAGRDLDVFAASVTLPTESFRRRAHSVVRVISVVFALSFAVSKLAKPARVTATDLVQRRESAWNLNGVIAERLKALGLQPGDRTSMVCQSIDSEWARIDDLTIVGEVPVLWDREEYTVSPGLREQARN